MRGVAMDRFAEFKPGDPVIVRCAFVDYNENTMLRASRIKPDRR